MGRHLKFDREKGVEQAMYHFWQHGYYNSTISHLSRAMGITRSSFYNTFGSREALFLEAIDCYQAMAPDAILREDVSPDTVSGRIRQVILDVCSTRTRTGMSGCLIVNSIAELAGKGDEHSDLLNTMVDSAQRRYEQLIEQAVDAKEIEAVEDVTTLSGLLVSYVAGLNLMTKVVCDETKLWRQAQLFLDRIGL